MTWADLPLADAHPPTRLLVGLRPVMGALIRRFWNVRLHGAAALPREGGVILASNHAGLIDGPLLALMTPRPVHALTKQEMLAGKLGPLLRAAGQIRVDRHNPDPGAMKTCLRVLHEGGVVGVFPEGTRGDGELRRFHHGPAYLALVSGAPVVPVTMIGTRGPGSSTNSLPSRKADIDIVLGRPWTTEQMAWPRTREHVLGASALLYKHMRAEVANALAQTRRSLPGPLPAGEFGSDPDTGFTDETREP